MAARGTRAALLVLVGVLAAVGLVASAIVLTGPEDPAPAAGGGGDDRERRTAAPDPKMDRIPADALLPNLVVLPAEELGIGGRGGKRVLRFASILANEGVGPLQVVPDNAEPCPPRQRYVEQRAFVDADGNDTFTRNRDQRTVRLPGGCMLFHPRHEHWHFDSTASYALTATDDDIPIVARDKVSFCLRDSEPHFAASDRHRRIYKECARNRRQGISVGWADRYDASLDGQRLRLPTGFVGGRYCLRLEVDPFDLLSELDEEDNTSAVVIVIRGRTVQRVAGATC